MDQQYYIDGEGRDETGARYFRIVLPDSAITVSAKTVVSEPSDIYAALTNAGVNCISAEGKRAVIQALQSFQTSEATFRVATKIGHFHKQFVLPGQVIGPATLPTVSVLDGLDQVMVAKYRTKGTLDEWQQQIAKLVNGNSRLMLGVTLAFTGPILPFVKGPRTGGFQISGAAETGKTTAATVAGSVWGCHVGTERQEKGFAESWHTTEGKVEVTAMAHNHTLLILDETQRAGRTAAHRAQVISDLAFSLAEGIERERLTNSKSSRAWQTYFLSTSNMTFSELAEAGNVAIDDQHLGRMFDIPCPPDNPHGIYETVHDFSNGERLSDALKRRCRRYCGTAGAEFARKVIADRNRDLPKLRKTLARYRARYRKALKRELRGTTLRSLTRTASRFATVYAAGRLAIKYRILLWEREVLLRAILNCHLSGLRLQADRRALGEPSEGELRRKLVAYLSDRRRFVDLAGCRPTKGSDAATSAGGYIGTDEEEGWLYLTARKVSEVVGDGPNAASLKRRLQSEGNLRLSRQGGFVVQRKIYSSGKGNENFAWVYAFNPDVLQRAE
jgi:putative DNA primase/helicase